jgi:protein gp37
MLILLRQASVEAVWPLFQAAVASRTAIGTGQETMSDLFGDWVSPVWILKVMRVVKKCNQHTFQFLTKNPSRLHNFNPWPKNAWVGATTSSEFEYEKALFWLPKVEAPVRFISAEPLLFKPTRMSKVIDWVIIGAQTGPGAPPVDPYAVQRLTLMSRRLGVPVFHKNNLGKLAQHKEFPGD